MILREYQPSDLKEILELFYHTVHSVNAKDYTPQQLDAWTGGTASFEAWNTSLLEHKTFVAAEGGIIIGFGDIDKKGVPGQTVYPQRFPAPWHCLHYL